MNSERGPTEPRFAHVRLLGALLLGTPALVDTVFAQSTSPSSSFNVLKKLSLDELMDIEVTSVSKRAEKLLDAPAAIQVITSEDIRRSGASSIPEALRLASNLDGAQENSHEWVISARGFSSDVGNKLLVMMDGSRLGVSLSAFFDDYHDVRSTSPSPPDPVFNLPFPFFFQNNLEGETLAFQGRAGSRLGAPHSVR